MEHSPSSETNSHSTSQEIPCPSWDSKFHYYVHRSLPLVSILNPHPHALFVEYPFQYYPSIYT
jgi:hypothetical protein